MAGYSARGWLLPESPRLAFGEPPPFGKGGLRRWVPPFGVCFPGLGIAHLPRPKGRSIDHSRFFSSSGP